MRRYASGSILLLFFWLLFLFLNQLGHSSEMNPPKKTEMQWQESVRNCERKKENEAHTFLFCKEKSLKHLHRAWTRRFALWPKPTTSHFFPKIKRKNKKRNQSKTVHGGNVNGRRKQPENSANFDQFLTKPKKKNGQENRAFPSKKKRKIRR